MYTTNLKVHYKNKCDRCGSWVNEADRYCPMCGYKAVADFNPKFDNLSDEQITQRLLGYEEHQNDNKIQQTTKLNFIISDVNYPFSVKMDESKLYIGSSPDCSIVVKRNYISRFHAMLTFNFNTNKLYINDNNSTNGTFLNGKKLINGALVEVKPNDIIKLSDSFVFVYLGQEKI